MGTVLWHNHTYMNGGDLLTNEIFDRSKRLFGQRSEHIAEGLGKKKIDSEYVVGELASNTKRGVYLQNIANYLLESPDIASGRRIKYSFYPSEKYYWTHSKTAESTVFGVNLDSVTYEKYQAAKLTDQNAYITRIFNANNVGAKEIHKFITLGMMSKSLSDYSSEMVEAICWLRSEITLACCRDGDLELLKCFDGDRGVVDAAKEIRVSHQNVSKKLKKICKNAEKRLRNEI